MFICGENPSISKFSEGLERQKNINSSCEPSIAHATPTYTTPTALPAMAALSSLGGSYISLSQERGQNWLRKTPSVTQVLIFNKLLVPMCISFTYSFPWTKISFSFAARARGDSFVILKIIKKKVIQCHFYAVTGLRIYPWLFPRNMHYKFHSDFHMVLPMQVTLRKGKETFYFVIFQLFLLKISIWLFQLYNSRPNLSSAFQTHIFNSTVFLHLDTHRHPSLSPYIPAYPDATNIRTFSFIFGYLSNICLVLTGGL